VDVLFLREGVRRSRSQVRRDDGVTLHVPGYSFDDVGWLLPHDLAHLIVERGLGLGRGFWGTVASGGVFPGMCVLEGRRPPHADERSRDVIRANGRTDELTRAEVMVKVTCRIARDGRDRDRGSVARLAGDWSPAPDALDAMPQVCAELREAAERWAALRVGEALAFDWPVPSRRTASRGTARTRRGARRTSPPRSRRPERSR
jgi:hypothetical protein